MTATDLDLDALLDALQARAVERANAAELHNVAGDPVGPGLRASTGRLQVNPGDLVASVWGNTTYDQTVEVFDNTAARDSQWPTPKDGAVSYTVDTGALWVRRAGIWKGVPIGYVASIVGPSTTVTCGATVTTLLTISPTLTAGRRYRLYTYAFGTASAAAAARFDVGGTDLGILPRLMPGAPIAGTAVGLSGVALVTPSVTGPRTLTLGGTVTSGTLTVNANQCELSIDDIGSQ